jgi:transposase-like protein
LDVRASRHGSRYLPDVHWPFTPTHRLQAFRPPFCPYPSCPSHHLTNPRLYRFRRHGFYKTRLCRRVPRFRCLHCERSLSRQAFSTRYFLKRPELLIPVASGLVAGSAHRQIARSFGCAPSTVSRLSARLGRHAIRRLSRALHELQGRLAESIVFDHFETFEFTQDLPFGIATAVGADPWFVYALDPAPHRRAGKLSAAQRRRLKRRPRRPTRGGYTGSLRRVIDALLPLCPGNSSLRLVGDGHPAYGRAVRSHPRSKEIELLSYPNPMRGPKGSPRSLEAIERDRARFPGDALHALLRHTLAHHRRETIAFGRRLNALMERIVVTGVWRNFVKGRSERRPDPTTPAMRVGLTGRAWSWPAVLARRLFLERERVPRVWRELYGKEWSTLVLPSNTLHRLKYAMEVESAGSCLARCSLDPEAQPGQGVTPVSGATHFAPP